MPRFAENRKTQVPRRRKTFQRTAISVFFVQAHGRLPEVRVTGTRGCRHEPIILAEFSMKKCVFVVSVAGCGVVACLLLSGGLSTCEAGCVSVIVNAMAAVWWSKITDLIYPKNIKSAPRQISNRFGQKWYVPERTSPTMMCS